jgi:hypothetical protein
MLECGEKRKRTGQTDEPTQRYYHVPRAWLLRQNRLLLFEETEAAIGSIPLEIRMWEGVSSKTRMKQAL